MNEQTDAQLLQAYAERHAEAAFAELVRRHLDLVFSAALRVVRDSYLAEDVAKGVFLALARNTRELANRPVLSGWLHRTAQNIAAQAVRTEVRRRAREEEAAVMNQTPSTESGALWDEVAPHLDAALSDLSEADRDAVMLRYFERKSARDMAHLLGISDEAAQKRVSRAVGRLRRLLAERGVTASASALVAVMSVNAVQAAPAELAGTVSAAIALTGSAITTTTTTTTNAIAMTTMQKALPGAVLTAAVGTGFFGTLQNARLRSQMRALERQQAPLAEQVQALQAELDRATNQAIALSEEIRSLRGNEAELLKLRGEVGVLTQTAASLSNELARSSNRYGLLPEQMPPVLSSSARDTAAAYARLVRKLTSGQLSAADELNLRHAWPYIDSLCNEPDSFAQFEAQYLAGILNITNQDMVWGIRRLLENGREQEHAQGLEWARQSEDQLRQSNLSLDMQKIREEWNGLNQKLTQQVLGSLSAEQQSIFAAAPWSLLDFDPRLKSAAPVSSTDPRFQNLTPAELLQSFLGPEARAVPATSIQKP